MYGEVKRWETSRLYWWTVYFQWRANGNWRFYGSWNVRSFKWATAGTSAALHGGRLFHIRNRQLFGASTILASASNGYELVIQELAEYQESEHCWRMIQIVSAFLVSARNGDTWKLAAITGLGNQTFLKQCRQLQTLFAAYELTLNKKQWCLEGAEGNIRYFYKAFYLRKRNSLTNLWAAGWDVDTAVSSLLADRSVVSLKWTKVFCGRNKVGAWRKIGKWLTFCRLFLENRLCHRRLEVCRSLSQQERCPIVFDDGRWRYFRFYWNIRGSKKRCPWSNR